jgi:regulator of RNase E activity RraA
VDSSRDIGFPVYARGGVPVTARGRIIQESFNKLIQCGGVQVRPGDLLIADWSGVVFVPQERAEEVIETAERIVEREAAMVQAVRAGRSVVEVMAESAFQAIHQT